MISPDAVTLLTSRSLGNDDIIPVRLEPSPMKVPAVIVSFRSRFPLASIKATPDNCDPSPTNVPAVIVLAPRSTSSEIVRAVFVSSSLALRANISCIFECAVQ